MAEIIGKSNAPISIDVKRFYLPGIVIKDNCPKCGNPSAFDLSGDYLSYPTANREEDATMFCRRCDHNWTVPIIIRLSVELANG